MIFGLNTYRRDEAYLLTPSLYADGMECSRRLWFRNKELSVEEGHIKEEKTGYLRSHIEDYWKERWRFDVYLPGRLHVDIWIPEEALFVDFRKRAAKSTDLIQCWLKMEEFKKFGLYYTEYQLWYPSDEKNSAEKLAIEYQLDHEINLCGFYAIAVDEPDKDFLSQSVRNQSMMISELERKSPPGKKEAESVACRGCSYLEFCHM